MQGAGKAGALGEVIASRRLRDDGYDILSANYHTRFGEIDLIASDGEYLVFVEVKTRRAGSLVRPCEAVDSSKQSKIIRTAALYLSSHPTALQPRFDVIEVWLKNGTQAQKVNHIKNAFLMEAGCEYF